VYNKVSGHQPDCFLLILGFSMTYLTVSDVTLSFGGLKALSNVNLKIQPNLITSIIGPNGAGKTSILNCISGFYHPTVGEIHFGGQRLTHASPHQVSKMGIARAFQNLSLEVRLFFRFVPFANEAVAEWYN